MAPPQFNSSRLIQSLGKLSRREDRRNWQYFQGDHWQRGAGWIGPRPSESSPEYQKTISEIGRGFVSQNVIRDVVRRRRNGVISRTPFWSFQPTTSSNLTIDDPRESSIIQEAEGLILSWWDDRDILQVLQDAVDRASTVASGRCPIRIFIPSKYLDDENRLQATSFEEALQYIHIEAVDPAIGGVVTDPETRETVSVFISQLTRTRQLEISYLDQDGLTRLQVLSTSSSSSTDPDESDPMDLRGRLLLKDLEIDPIISDQIVQHQNQLNMTKTMSGRNVILGGFIERTLLNAQLPGRFEIDPETGVEKFIPEDFQVGPGTTNFFQGVEIRDDLGNLRGFSSPSLVYRDPVSVSTFTDTAHDIYRSILQEAHQLHALIGSDGGLSEESRIQAKADFIVDLLHVKSRLDQLGRWLLETVLSLIADISGRPGYFNGLKVTFDAVLSPGPISPAEMEVMMNLVDAFLMSRETAMVRVGIEDTTEERRRIQEEQNEIDPIRPIRIQRAQLALDADRTDLERDQINATSSVQKADGSLFEIE